MAVTLLVLPQVVRVRDSLGQVYSVPYYSSIQIGLVADNMNEGSAKKGNTLHKTAKAADIMAMKVGAERVTLDVLADNMNFSYSLA